jgi:hypothetical protein
LSVEEEPITEIELTTIKRILEKAMNMTKQEDDVGKYATTIVRKYTNLLFRDLDLCDDFDNELRNVQHQLDE